MKQVDVQIMGASYTLGCKEEAEADLMRAVRLVDTHMCKIRDTGKTKARERVAVLAALNITAELHEENTKLQEKIATLESQNTELQAKDKGTASVQSAPTQPSAAALPTDLTASHSDLADSASSDVPLDANIEDLLQRVDSALGGTEGRLF